MNLKGKKILFVCKETYSYPLFYIAQKWKTDNEVAAFFFNPIESKLNECEFNDTTYWMWKKNKDIVIYTSDEIADEFTQKLDNPPVDYDYLNYLEENYTRFRNLNVQIISSQYLTRHYHYRNYMFPVTYDQQMYWLELNYRNAIRILDEFKPDYIIDCDAAELARLVLLEVSWKRNIPYLSLESTRYDSYRTITFTLGMENDEYFINEYYKNTRLDTEALAEELSYIDEFRKSSTIMAKEFTENNEQTAKYKPDGFFSRIKQGINAFQYSVIDQDIRAKNRSIKSKNPIIYGDSIEFTKFNLHRAKVRDKLLKQNKYFESPVKDHKYVYMPLHLIPESTTFTKAPFYINELSVIEAVSKALPIGWYLYVKEHPAMLGERGIDFYERVKKLPNVKMMQLNYYEDPKPWIVNSMGVVTITGTSAYEAAVLGKPALVFGEILFSLIDGVYKVESLNDLPKLIRGFSNYVHSDLSCAAYIKTVKDLGVKINMLKIMNDGLMIYRNQYETPTEWREEVEKLETLFLTNIGRIANQ